MWAGYIVFVLATLALDLFVFGGRKAHRVHVKEALAWVIAWVYLALAFAGLLWWYLNDSHGAEVARTKTLEFLAGLAAIFFEVALSLTVSPAYQTAVEWFRKCGFWAVFIGYLHHDVVMPLDERSRDRFTAKNEALAEQVLRVRALAGRVFPAELFNPARDRVEAGRLLSHPPAQLRTADLPASGRKGFILCRPCLVPVQ